MANLTPNPDLYGRIIDEIHFQKELLAMKRRLILYGLALATSVCVLGIAFGNFFAAAHQSGLLELLKLSLTDFHAVTVNFSDYFLSLVDALPAISVGLSGIVLLVVVGSAVKFTSYFFKIKHLKVS